MANFWPTFPHEERKNSHLGFLWKFQGVPFVLNTRALQILQKRARAILLKQHTQEKWTQNSTWDGDSFGIVLSLSLSSLFCIWERRERSRASFLSLFLPFFGGGNYSSLQEGESQCKTHTHTDRLFFSLSTSLINETAITCSSSWCVLLLRFVFLIVGFLSFITRVLSSVCRIENEIRVGWCKKELLGIFCFLSFSLSLNECLLIGVVSLSSTHAHS